eukprot:jgi/Psemu1/328205/estExt_fgenesh1_pg.C_10800003
MLVPRTRSSRLFLVILHLVCVSTNLRPKSKRNGASFVFWEEAAAARQTLETTSTSIISLVESNKRDSTIHDISKLEPYWLQDAQDQKCFGSMGLFSECGDANLWRVIPKSKRHVRRRQWIRWAIEDDDVDREAVQGYYALQVFDQDISEFYDPSGTNVTGGSARASSLIHTEEDFTNKECMTRRRKDNKLVIVPCSEDRAWYWRLNQHGILHFDKPARGLVGSSRRASSTNRKRLLNKRQHLELCVWRSNVSEVVLSSCDGNQPASINFDSTTSPVSNGYDEERLAQVQLVRHNYQSDTRVIQSSPSTSETQSVSSKTKVRIEKQTDGEGEKISERSGQVSSPPQAKTNLPSRVDIAHSHASVSSDRTEPRLSTLHVKSILPHQSADRVSKELPRFLQNTNPILIATGHNLTTATSKPSVSKGNSKKKSSRIIGKGKNTPQSMLHNKDSLPSHLNQKPIVRKIQTNPYVEASNDERWTDPQTGLVFRTDLCQYLGHERKEVGRHTLTGVGQYTKTMLNIKVYGVGFYVSKRDILADPSFEPYASLSSEGLRQSEDFFGILRSMKGFTTTTGPTGSFDRTIFLKINMQLSTDTMRSSLDADWKMLTSESKQLLIGSSMKPRPADPIFLEIAKSPDNPNRCTCAQVAPEEYGADPSCCARGTELVFTWRKNGNLEVRLNGVFMDSFPRPDIAEGIFYEYLRLDNPMSFDFLDRVVDGFPSLLAPLSQLEGITTAVNSHQTNMPNPASSGGNPFFKVIGVFGGAISTQAASIAEFVQSGTQELAGNAIDKARSVGSTAKTLGEEVERRRDLIGKHVSAFTNQALSSLVPSNQKGLSIQYPGWITDSELQDLSENLFEEDDMAKPDLETSYRQTLSRLIGLDDDSMSASNATQKVFFGLVHLYLLLLLIASFPAQWTTRTKLVVTRKRETSSHNVTVPTDSENSDSDDSGASSVEALDTDSMMSAKENQIKKSLSYVL